MPGTALGAPAHVRGGEPSLGESSLAGLENLTLEKMLLHCFQRGSGKAVPAPGCSGQSLAGWGCCGSQGCCPEIGLPQQEPCCSLLFFPPKGRFAPRAQFRQSGRAEGNTPSPCPAASASPSPPPGQPGQRRPGNSPRHFCTALGYGKGRGETFRGGSAPRITSKTPRATSLQGHSSTAGPTASKSSLREGAPAPAPFPGKPWPRAAGRGCRHRSPLPSRELSIPSCQPGPGASERGRRQV